jgi:prepilin-type N-terminal cleavage/methylation domain-containing protein
MTRRDVDNGYSLLEALAAIAIVGMGLLAASSGLQSQAMIAQRTDLQLEMLAAAEEVIEGVRADAIPLHGGRVATPFGRDVETESRVHTFLEVVPLHVEGLHEVTVTARSSLPGQHLELELVTLVWRP